MVKVGDEYAISILNIMHGTNHFEPTNVCNEIVNECDKGIQNFQKIKNKMIKNIRLKLMF
jgi:hypothetical protein